MKPQTFLTTLFFLTTLPIQAQITTDGSLGPVSNLTGPHFEIKANLGKQEGNNLFHSFRDFNIKSEESATFLPPENLNLKIENVISRVTGGNPSNIDGVFRSTIPNADVYFLNPAGIIFGPNAILDVPGSFHASTADYLRFSDGGRFDATYSEQPLLTVAPPSAFGFLSDSPAGIYKEGGFLMVPVGKTFSFIGGDIIIQDNLFPIGGKEFNSFIAAFDGKIQLASVASAGEVPVNLEEMPDNAFEQFGKIILIDNSEILDRLLNNSSPNIDVSGIGGTGGGKIYIIGGQIVLENSYLFADTLGNQDGKGITIKAEDLRLTQGSRIAAQIVGIPAFENTGNGGNINITAERITIADGSQIDTSSTIPPGLPVDSRSLTGAVGNITLSATESINMSGCLLSNCSTRLYSSLQSTTIGSGKGGQITVSTPTLTMDNNATIRSETQNMGKAGDISINVDTLSLTGGAQINLSAGSKEIEGANTGHAGKLTIEAQKNIHINGYGYEGLRSGLFSNTFTTGEGGTIEILAPTGILQLQDNGTIQSGATSLGEAGNIFLTVADMVLDNAAITTESAESAGGDINIQLTENLQLIKGKITTKALGDEKRDRGGNITINHPNFLILDKSQLTTTGFVGDGGNIGIVAEQFIQSSDSLLDASSTLGVDGEIFIDASIEDFIELNLLSSQFGQSQLQILPCATRLPKEMSTFTLGARQGLLASPDDLQR